MNHIIRILRKKFDIKEKNLKTHSSFEQKLTKLCVNDFSPFPGMKFLHPSSLTRVAHAHIVHQQQQHQRWNVLLKAETQTSATMRPPLSIGAWRSKLRGRRGSCGPIETAHSRPFSSARKGMRKWRSSLKQQKEALPPAEAPQSPPPPAHFQHQVQQDLPPQPSFVGSMVTYLMLGAGVTAGIVFVRVLTGMEGAPTHLEEWPSRPLRIDDERCSGEQRTEVTSP